MSCLSPDSKPDWKAYALGEASTDARRQAEAHASSCAACRDELAELRLTLDTLSTLREEEIPRRIAFVSDKVFEPRWWQRIFTPGFAGACVVAVAILVHAFVSPTQRVEAAVSKAVGPIDARQTEFMKAVADYLDQQDKLSREAAYRNTGLIRE